MHEMARRRPPCVTTASLDASHYATFADDPVKQWPHAFLWLYVADKYDPYEVDARAPGPCPCCGTPNERHVEPTDYVLTKHEHISPRVKCYLVSTKAYAPFYAARQKEAGRHLGDRHGRTAIERAWKSDRGREAVMWLARWVIGGLRALHFAVLVCDIELAREVGLALGLEAGYLADAETPHAVFRCLSHLFLCLACKRVSPDADVRLQLQLALVDVVESGVLASWPKRFALPLEAPPTVVWRLVTLNRCERNTDTDTDTDWLLLHCLKHGEVDKAVELWPQLTPDQLLLLAVRHGSFAVLRALRTRGLVPEGCLDTAPLQSDATLPSFGGLCCFQTFVVELMNPFWHAKPTGLFSEEWREAAARTLIPDSRVNADASTTEADAGFVTAFLLGCDLSSEHRDVVWQMLLFSMCYRGGTRSAASIGLLHYIVITTAESDGHLTEILLDMLSAGVPLEWIELVADAVRDDARFATTS